MKIKKSLFTILITSCILASNVIVSTDQQFTQAATFTTNEVNLMHKLQNNYAALDKTPYSNQNLYQIKPNLTAPFSSGVLKPAYVDSQLAYINYYRSLFDLPAISADQVSNDNAQTAASVMASMNANPFVNLHGLPNQKQPSWISDLNWNIAKDATANSNLNFNVSNESAGDVITDLITDSYNLSGQDTGHRAWLLSPWLTTTGIGAAYGTNGYRYSVQRVINITDPLRAPAKTTVTYPSDGLFPIELLHGSNIAWSLYLTDQVITSNPQITITDLDTGQKSFATNVQNYNKEGFGNFSTILTYYPGNIALISGHQYQVNINNVYQYSFKLFNEVASRQPVVNTQKQTEVAPKKKAIPKPTQPNPLPVKPDLPNITIPETNIPVNTVDTLPTEQKDIIIKSALLISAEHISDSLNPRKLYNSSVFGRSYQDGSYVYNLGSNQWISNFYQVQNPDIHAGILNVDSRILDRKIYTSPYLFLQKPNLTYLANQHAYPYGQSIKIGYVTWYYLGPNQWVKALTN